MAAPRAVIMMQGNGLGIINGICQSMMINKRSFGGFGVICDPRDPEVGHEVIGHFYVILTSRPD